LSTFFSNSASGSSPKPPKTGCVRVIAGVFFLLGAFILYVDTIHPMLQTLGALRWVETPCVVDSSREVIRRSGSHGATYYIEVVYHYSFDGRTYTSKRYLFSASSSVQSRVLRIVKQHPPGTRTVCYVNPNAPTEAVMLRGLNPEMGFGAIGLPFLLLGGAGLYFATVISGARRVTQHHTVPQPRPMNGELVALKPEATPFGKFLFMLGFATFWNGFIGIFFYLTFLQPGRADVGIFPKIFVGIFSFIGLLLIGGVFGTFFALFYPKVRLRSRASAVALGGEFPFQWDIGGRVERLRTFRIVLEGREETVIRRGKSTEIRREVFTEMVVVEAADREILAEGQGRVVIPAGSMHTFHGRNNKIVWHLRVRGEILHLANLEEDFEILVLPHSASA
jgi:hypothetical protein